MKLNLAEKLAIVKALDTMIIADGRVDDGELEYLGQLMSVLEFDLEFIEEARTLNWVQAIDVLKGMSNNKKNVLYTMLSEMAEADGTIDDTERRLIVSLKLVIGFDNITPISTKPQLDLDDIYFVSSDHLRYQNGVHVSGPHGGAKRAVKVEPSISGGEGYSVSVYNMDGDHPLWGNNVQMSPKQMKVIRETADETELRGFGYDAMGSPFSDYGITISHNNGNIESITLHMHDRGVEIKYLK